MTRNLILVFQKWPHALACVIFSMILLEQTYAYGYPEIIGSQTDQRLQEVSGLAASFAQPSYFWAINDSGNAPALLLLNDQGKYTDKVELSTLGNYDWEDLETFRYGGQNYIAIADIGDNYTRRKVYYVHIVPEPSVSMNGQIGRLDSANIKTIAFQYEDGPRDAEALGIDLPNNRILVLSKRDVPPRMYSIPLVMNPHRFVYRASHVANITELGGMSFSGGSLSQTLYAGLPTAMTVLPAVQHEFESIITRLAVLSYGAVWFLDLFNQNPAFARETLRIQLPVMPQAEAIAADMQGNLTVMSEMVGSSMVRIPKVL